MIDAINRKRSEAQQKNARLSYAERIRNLESTGVITGHSVNVDHDWLPATG